MRSFSTARGRKVLVAGVFLADKPNTAAHIVTELTKSEEWQVDQRWIGLGAGSVPRDLQEVTVERWAPYSPKFVVVNRILRDASLDEYSFVLVCDDDVRLPAAFLDEYLARVCRHDFALAQPARTHDSFIDHVFVERLDGISARQTRFVEIGPLFSIRNDALPALLPFDLSSPMGWGYDLAWPVVLAERQLRLGIVDSTPVSHSIRPAMTHYDGAPAHKQMNDFLLRHPHLTRGDAFTILESYL